MKTKSLFIMLIPLSTYLLLKEWLSFSRGRRDMFPSLHTPYFKSDFLSLERSEWIFPSLHTPYCKPVFGSDRSSSSHFVCPSVCPAQVCLEQSIFIFLGQRAIRALKKQSESTQKAIKAIKSESYSRSLKYCVLLSSIGSFMLTQSSQHNIEFFIFVAVSCVLSPTETITTSLEREGSTF